MKMINFVPACIEAFAPRGLRDRRRWVNPRLDRVDSPQLLGLLNLLYDLLEKHGHVLDFPFPLRKPGTTSVAVWWGPLFILVGVLVEPVICMVLETTAPA